MKKSLRKKSVKCYFFFFFDRYISNNFDIPKHFGSLGFTLVFCVYCWGKKLKWPLKTLSLAGCRIYFSSYSVEN